VYETIGQTHILVFEYTRKGIQVEGDRMDCGVTPGPTLRGGAVVRLDMFMPDEFVSFPFFFRSLLISNQDKRFPANTHL